MDIWGKQQLDELESLDEVSRERWRNTAADMVIQNCEFPYVLNDLVAAGKFKFLADAKRAFHGHAFHETDYVAMWERIRAANTAIQKHHKRRGLAIASG